MTGTRNPTLRIATDYALTIVVLASTLPLLALLLCVPRSIRVQR